MKKQKTKIKLAAKIPKYKKRKVSLGSHREEENEEKTNQKAKVKVGARVKAHIVLMKKKRMKMRRSNRIIKKIKSILY